MLWIINICTCVCIILLLNTVHIYRYIYGISMSVYVNSLYNIYYTNYPLWFKPFNWSVITTKYDRNIYIYEDDLQLGELKENCLLLKLYCKFLLVKGEPLRWERFNWALSAHLSSLTLSLTLSSPRLAKTDPSVILLCLMPDYFTQ